MAPRLLAEGEKQYEDDIGATDSGLHEDTGCEAKVAGRRHPIYRRNPSIRQWKDPAKCPESLV